MDKYFIEFILGDKQSLDDAIQIAKDGGYKQFQSINALDKPGHSILVLSSDGTYCVTIRSKDELLFDGYEEIKLYKKYPDGTKVKIIGNCSGHGLPMGTICTVKYDKDDDSYIVTDKEIPWYLTPKDIEILESSIEFKVGDIIKFKTGSTRYVITSISDNAISYKHLKNGNQYSSYKTASIEIINKTYEDYSNIKDKCLFILDTIEWKEWIKNNVEYTFKLGDIVKVINTGNMCSSFDEAAEAMGLTKWVRSNCIYSSEQKETILKYNYYKVIGSYEYNINKKLYIGIENLFDGNQYIIFKEGIEHTLTLNLTWTNTGSGCIDYPISYVDTSQVSVNNKGEIQNTLLTNNNIMEKLNQLRADKFFANEKNLVAIETLDTLLKDSIDLVVATKEELDRVQSKLIGLNRKLELATNNQDVAMLKDLIASTKVVQEFVDELKGKTISKFETAKTKFDVAGYLKD